MLFHYTKFLRTFPWLECVLFLAVLTLTVGILTADVASSGTWDGEPSLHNRHVQEAVNLFVKEYQSGGDPARGFLQCFYMFPKMLHDIMLTFFVLVCHGVEMVDFASVELLGAWHSTLWTLVSLVPIYVIMRQYQSRVIALFTLPVVALSGYILLYANFPRQNMPAHSLTWIALSIYLYYRVRSVSLPKSAIFSVGFLLGIAVPVHYSSVYAFFPLALSELVLGIYDRRICSGLLSFVLLFCSACAVWFALDLYFAIYIMKYPDEINWLGESIKGNTFISGMVQTYQSLETRVAAVKLEKPEWWFLGGFLCRNFGLAAVLIAIGSVDVLQSMRRQLNNKNSMTTRAMIILLVHVLVALAVSLSYFQNARKLMCFYPYWCVLLAIGLNSLTSSVAGFIARPGGPEPARPFPPTMVVTLLVIFMIQAAVFLPTASAIFHARRDSGYMRSYLKRHNIEKILILPQWADSYLAPTQTNLRELTLEESDQFQFIVLNRLYPSGYGKEFIENIRSVAPVISFPNQASLPLFWYEFPLKKDFMDLDDPLVCSRSLYRWPEVRDYCRGFLKQTP